MLGLDSRSAMTPGGATEGFGNLAAALLLAPQLRKKMDQDAADRQSEQDFKDRQLAQALQIAQMQDRNERARIHDAYQAEQDAKDYRNRQADIAASNSARQWAGTLGTGIANLGQALGFTGKASGGHEFKPMEVNPYVEEESIDPETGKRLRHKRLKTMDEVQNQLQIQDALRGALRGQAPKADSGSGAANKARSAQFRADQRAQGLAQAPGDPKPEPSTAGVGEVMPVETATPAPVAAAPVASAGPTTALAPMLTKAHLMSRVADGTFPNFEAAYQDATSRGYTIQDM